MFLVEESHTAAVSEAKLGRNFELTRFGLGIYSIVCFKQGHISPFKTPLRDAQLDNITEIDVAERIVLKH